MSQREYARTRNISHTAVQKAIGDGRLSNCIVIKGRQKKINPEIADKEWASNTNHDRRPNNADGNLNANDYGIPADAKERKKLPKTLKQFQNQISFEGNPPDMAESRAHYEAYKALLAKLEYEEKAKILIPSDEIQEVWNNVLKSFQVKIRAIPTKLTPLLSNVSAEDEIEKILSDALDEALTELSKGDEIES